MSVSWGKEEIRSAVENAKTFDDIVELISLVCTDMHLVQNVKNQAILKDKVISLFKKAKSQDLRPIEAHELLAMMNEFGFDITRRLYEENEDYSDIFKNIKENAYTKPLMEDLQSFGEEALSDKWNVISNKVSTIEGTEKQLRSERQQELKILDAELDDRHDKIEKISYEAGVSGVYTDDQLEERIKAAEDLRDISNKRYEINAKYNDLIDDLYCVKQAVYDEIMSLLKKQSPVSEEMATAWAKENVYLDKGEKAKLKKIGYSEDDLRRDVAEFYQLVGGKIGPIKFTTTRGDRAYASGLYTIAISKYFGKRTLFHELGHIVEHFDKKVYAANNAFIKTRATGPIEKLRKLEPRVGYQSNEEAYPDHFIDPYVGKVYSHDSTEVLSMGIQNFINADMLTNFIKNDKKHFDLIVGICRKRSAITEIKIKESKNNLKRKINIAKQQQENDKKFLAILDKMISNEFSKKILSEEGYKNYRLVAGRNRYWIDRNEYGEWWYLNNTAESKKSCLRIAYLLIVNDVIQFSKQSYVFYILQLLKMPSNYKWAMDVVDGSVKLPEV